MFVDLPIDLTVTHCGILKTFSDAVHRIQQNVGTVPA